MCDKKDAILIDDFSVVFRNGTVFAKNDQQLILTCTVPSLAAPMTHLAPPSGQFLELNIRNGPSKARSKISCS